MMGRVCTNPPFQRLQITIPSGGLGGLELNTEHLSSGIYQLKIVGVDGSIINRKFVKQ
ncbi:MAG: hypothetical protein RL708_923 [Bacteroidota bacterium]